MTEYDVIIVGGAMTGSCLALALEELKQPLRIAVIEASSGDDEHPGFDARAIALAQGSIDHLKQLGLWQYISAFAQPISRIEVSDRGHAGATEMTAQDYGVGQLGAVIELELVGKSLINAVKERSIDLYQPDSIKEIVQHQDDVEVFLSSGNHLRGKLIVAADGTFSSTCEQVGLKREITPFGQHAIISNIVTQVSHEQCAFERFTSSGPVALLPMRAEHPNQSRMSLVLCVNESQVHQVSQYSDQQFIDYLQSAFGWRLGRILKAGQRSQYPLSLHRRHTTTHHRVVAIGNAAQTLHPIAGQGFNLGLRDVVALVRVIACGTYELGCPKQLLNYRKARKADVDNTCLLTHALVTTFSTNNPLISASRNVGLMAMDWLSPVQRPLVEQTLGWVGSRPQHSMVSSELNRDETS
ncbi:2-octaprenyl-6-methoxyphenyl hydroxylase [Vibrio ulleungensis]|uniref:2-octaprenyl-6-methoxyphenyl hydroxylase n=1 Tax=Vibrio ulleungensis TaxID=2807619 RepID=A0ABS2HLM2_9VIBR|nr:2-octaprenyl-6-methoxyphenyl hydroxylase [Vibrio ulleungensis]MBM7037914.1 2-octaprenyl-6-methoxyphenyl hydroxylase [Vibrio ulleungensis]